MWGSSREGTAMDLLGIIMWLLLLLPPNHSLVCFHIQMLKKNNNNNLNNHKTNPNKTPTNEQSTKSWTQKFAKRFALNDFSKSEGSNTAWGFLSHEICFAPDIWEAFSFFLPHSSALSSNVKHRQ